MIEKTRASKYLKPYMIQEHGPLKASNSAGCFFMTKNMQAKKAVSTTIIVYLPIFAFLAIFRLPGLKYLEARVLVSCRV